MSHGPAPVTRRARTARVLLGAAAALAVAVPAAHAADPTRAYEQVTSDVGNSVLLFSPSLTPDGDHVYYTTFNHPAPDANSGGEMLLSTRGEDGWTPAAVPNTTTRFTGRLLGLSADFSRWISADLADTGFDSDTTRLFVRGGANGPVAVTPNADLHAFYNATADAGVVLFGSDASLDPSKPHPGVPGLYLGDGGAPKLVTVDESGSPVPCGPAAFASAAVSPDGSHAVFQAKTGPPTCAGNADLWRYDAATRTSTKLATNLAATATFIGGDASFSTLYVRTTAALEGADVNATADLYRLAGSTWTRLSKFAAGDDASVTSAAVSADGRNAFFVANKAIGGTGTDGNNNFYAYPDGASQPAFVASASASDPANLEGGTALTGPPLSADGTALVFASSVVKLPSEGSYTGPRRIFRYSTTAGELTCVSCAVGVTPTGAATSDGSSGAPLGMQISADGERVAFVTTTKLVDADTNGKLDAYLYDHGVIRLISPGDYPFGIHALPVSLSRSGRDYLFASTQLITGTGPQDVKLFDARVGGGFPVVTPETPCAGDACQGPASTLPSFGASGTSTFSGPGNAVPAPPPAIVEPPAPSLAPQRISAKQRRRFARTGRITLKVRVAGGKRVVAKARGRVAGRTRTLGTASKTPTGTGTQTVTLTVRLAKAAKRELSRKGRLKVKVTVTSAGAKTRTLSLTLVKARG